MTKEDEDIWNFGVHETLQKTVNAMPSIFPRNFFDHMIREPQATFTSQVKATPSYFY